MSPISTPSREQFLAKSVCAPPRSHTLESLMYVITLPGTVRSQNSARVRGGPDLLVAHDVVGLEVPTPHGVLPQNSINLVLRNAREPVDELRDLVVDEALGMRIVTLEHRIPIGVTRVVALEHRAGKALPVEDRTGEHVG